MIKLDPEYYIPGNITPRMLPTKIVPSGFLPTSFLACARVCIVVRLSTGFPDGSRLVHVFIIYSFHSTSKCKRF